MSNYYIILKWCFLACLLGVFFILLNPFQLYYEPNKNIEINYMGDNNYSTISKDYITEISIQFLNTRDSLAKDINTSLLEDLILQDKYIKKAEVYLDLEGSLNIFIYFREPFVRIFRNNEIYYCDSEWVILPELSKVDKNLLIVSGDLDEQGFDYLFQLVSKIYNHKMLNKLIGGIHYDNESGYVLSAKVCDLGINLGKQPVLDKAKINTIEMFYSFLSKELNCDYCKSINMEYDKQIICIK